MYCESFGTSFLCLFVYHYYNFLAYNRTPKPLIISGFFLTMAVLFKPYLSLLFILIGLEFIKYEYKNFGHFFLKNISKNILLVSFPLLILDAPWVVRNYIVFNRFIPFQQDASAGYNYSPAYLAEVDFITSIGESYVFWDKRSAGCYFESHRNFPCEYEFPKRIFDKSLTMQQIQDARNTYMEFQKVESCRNQFYKGKILKKIILKSQ